MPQEGASAALDLMVEAGWVRQYARNPKTGVAIAWTDSGRTALETVWTAIDKLGPENLNQQVWWTVGALAILRFRPGGKGSLDLGVTEL